MNNVYQKQELVESFPAYDVYARDSHTLYGTDGGVSVVELTAGDILGLKHARGFYRTYSLGSVVSYALSYNEDPIEAVEHAKSRGEKLHWINARGACLTSHRREKETIIKVEPGLTVRFEGKLFTVVTAPNDNLDLRPL